MDEKIVTVLNEMSEYLSIPQMKKLQDEYSGAAEPPFRCGVSHLSGMS